MRATLLLLAALCVSSCATTQPYIDAGKACFDEANATTANKILPDVNAALGCAFSSKETLPQCAVDSLQTIGAQWGSAALMCALDKIANGVSLDPSGAPLRRQRAKAALERARVSWRSTPAPTMVAGICPYGICVDSPPPGFGPGLGGG